MKSILFVKIESNGLPKTKENVITRDILDKYPNLISLYYKIGKINNDTKKVDISLQSYHIIKPNFELNKYAQKVHELTDDELSNGEDIKDVLNKMKKDLDENNVKIIIGHNVLFDLNLTKAEILRNNLNIDLDKYDLVDTISYKHSYDFPKLEVLYEKLYGRKFKKSHKRKSLINIIIKCFEHLYQLED